MDRNSFRILTTFSEVKSHVDQVIKLADANKKALGFLQKGVFIEQAKRGRLWIALSLNSGDYLGYLLFGGRYPTLRVFQLFVRKSDRKVGIAEKLISSLIEWGEQRNYSSISARVASDLSANGFWERIGFWLIRQEPGGKSSDRMINIRVKELSTPSLLNFMSYEPLKQRTGLENIKLTHRPIVSSQTYVIDLNIFFDIIKKRVHRDEATKLISTGLSQEARICVTPEFTKELERNSHEAMPDPILEFARTLPVLPEVPTAEIEKLRPELVAMIFPGGISPGRQEVRSVSDIIHIAYCIHHRATGFITREHAILAVSEKLREAYLLEALSPSDLLQPVTQHGRTHSFVHANVGVEHVSVSRATETERCEIEKFLVSRGASQSDITTIWHPGAVSSPRHRVKARVGSDIIAVASWDSPIGPRRSTVLHLYVDESYKRADVVIDHFLEVALRDTTPGTVRLIVLNSPVDQAETRTTAAKRGFLKSFPAGHSEGLGQLSKLTVNGLISSQSWGVFRGKAEEATGLKLPTRIPTFEEFTNTGIVLKNPSDTLVCNLNLFDFETLVSPGVVLCPGRAALMVPIQLRYAKDLFSYVQAQMELFPSPEALLHVEKAYFRSTKRVAQFSPGTLVFFYLSGSGGGSKEVIGCARITYSEVLSPKEAELTLSRQGALSCRQLEEIANSNGKVHAFTFDNFNAFTTRVPFSFLKDKSLVSGANLITVEKISANHCAQLCEYGFRLRRSVDA